MKRVLIYYAHPRHRTSGVNRPMAEAAQTYTILTVGDGLVSQIPALIISTSAGLLVTRSTGKKDFGTDLKTQFSIHTIAIWVVAAILLIFALIPGLPFLPFLTLSISLGLLGYYLDRQKKLEIAAEELEVPEAPAKHEENYERPCDDCHGRTVDHSGCGHYQLLRRQRSPRNNGVDGLVMLFNISLLDDNVTKLQHPHGSSSQPTSPLRTIQQRERDVGQRSRQRNARESCAGTHVDNSGSLDGAPRTGNAA